MAKKEETIFEKIEREEKERQQRLMANYKIAKEEYYSADIGCFAIEVNGSIVRYPNGYGDGTFKVYLFDTYADFEGYALKWEATYGKKLDYRNVSYSTFNNARALKYDTLTLSQINDYNTLFTLNGTYNIYYSNGRMFIVKEDTPKDYLA